MHFNKILKQTIAWRLINTVLLFLINLLLVRLLGVAGSGSFFYDIAVFSFLILILSWSLDAGITYYASKDKTIITTIISFIVPLLLLQCLITWIVLTHINFSVNIYLALLFIISNLIIIYFSAFFYAQKWFISLNKITCSVNFVTALVLFYCCVTKTVVAKNYHIILLYISSVATQALLLIIVMMLSTKKTTPSFIIAKPVIKNIVTYSSIAIISNVVTFLVTRIDYFFVQKYCSSIALGNYIQVSKFGQLLILVPSIIASLIFPLSAGDSGMMSTEKVQKICRTITLVFIPVTIIIITTGYWILPWLFGNGFSYMYVALLIYLPGFFSLSIIAILAAHLAGENFLTVNMIACILALIIVVTGDLWLIPIGGINAAAAVSSIAYIIYAIYLLIVYKKKFKCTIADFFSINKIEIAGIVNWFKK